jgi:hypothetical protein
MTRAIDSYHLGVLAFLNGQEKSIHFGRLIILPGGLEAASDLVGMGMVDRTSEPDMTSHAQPEDFYRINDRGKVFLNLILDYASGNL